MSDYDDWQDRRADREDRMAQAADDAAEDGVRWPPPPHWPTEDGPE